MTQIFKFGGASIKDAGAIRNMRKILQHYEGSKLLIVVSAMGKTTTRLEEIADLAAERESFSRELSQLMDFHLNIVEDLGIDFRENGSFRELESQLKRSLQNAVKDSLKFKDHILAFGELFSSTIICEYLKSFFDIKWVDARTVICTSDDYGEARVQWERTYRNITAIKSDFNPQFILTQGYIGRTGEGDTTTLGKEGSDFTAAIFANGLDAESMTVWKDVSGILNADPKLMDEVSLFPKLSYQEITEMTYYGAKVIHPNTILPLTEKEIPLHVRSFLDTGKAGTLINNDDVKVTLPTYVFKFDQMIVTLRVRDSSFMDEDKLTRIFQVLNEQNVKINLMQNSALTFTFCFTKNFRKLEKIRKALTADFLVTYNTNLHLATIKNYDDTAFGKLPEPGEIVLEQKSRSVYQVLYFPKNN